MCFLKKHLEKKQVQKDDLENCEQSGVPSVPSVPSELEKPASIDINCDSASDEKESQMFQVVFQGCSKLEADGDLLEKPETLPQALIDWLLNPRTQGGDEWPIPQELLPSFDDLVTKADALVRERDPRCRIWHGNKCLRLKAWVWDSEPPPYRRPRKQSKRYP